MELLKEIERVYTRRGNKIKRVFRCPSGFRKGRKVANISTCFAKRKSPMLRNKMRISNKRTKVKRLLKTRIANKKAIHFRLIRLNKALRSR